MDKILDDLDEEKKDTIDIFGFVKDMRTRRVNMVQTSVSTYWMVLNFYSFYQSEEHVGCEMNITLIHNNRRNFSPKYFVGPICVYP